MGDSETCTFDSLLYNWLDEETPLADPSTQSFMSLLASPDLDGLLSGSDDATSPSPGSCSDEWSEPEGDRFPVAWSGETDDSPTDTQLPIFTSQQLFDRNVPGMDSAKPEEPSIPAPVSSTTQKQRKRSRAQQAQAQTPGKLPRPCMSCRLAKVLCDRNSPCTRCVRLGTECVIPKTVPRGRPSRARIEERQAAAPPKVSLQTFVPSPHSLSPSALSGEGTQEDSELEDGDVLPSGGGLEDEPLLSRDHVAVV